MNLHRLLEWDLIEKVNIQGKRKDYYIAEKDVWKIVSQIIKERQQREIAPIRENLMQTIKTLESEEMTESSEAFKERIENYIEFLEMFERFTNALLPYISKSNLGFLKQLVKLVEFKDSVKEFTKKSSKEEGIDE